MERNKWDATERIPPFACVYITHQTSNIKHAALAAQLAFVFSAVEMALRFCDEPVIVDLPKFVAADSNAFSRAAWSDVGSLQRPMELRSLFVAHDLVHRHDHVWKCG